MTNNRFPKDPDAVKDYHFDWRAWLAGDTIDSYTLIPSPGLTISSHSQAGGVITLWVSGGTDGTTATVQCRIVTAAGRRDDDVIYFNVRNKV